MSGGDIIFKVSIDEANYQFLTTEYKSATVF